jgi:thermitase
MLASAAVAMVLATGAAWAESGPSDNDEKIAEVPTAGTAAQATFVPDEVVVETETGEYETRKVEAQSLGEVEDAAAEIETRDPTVVEAGPNFSYGLDFVPDDLRFDQQDWLPAIKALGAWEDSRGAAIRIGVVDTGWQLDPTSGQPDHPDMIRASVGQHDFVEEDIPANPQASDGYHGTAVAGVAAADTNNTRGVASIGFNASVIMAKACADDPATPDPGAFCKTEDTVQAIDWLVQTRGVDIINLSFGDLYSDGTTDPLLREAIVRAQNAGVLVVAAAGNDNTFTDNDPATPAPANYPSCFAGVIGVGSVNDLGTRASFSNYGPCVDLVAPGQSVLTTFDVNYPITASDGSTVRTQYASLSGTSVSSPQVAGTAALIKARNSLLSSAQIASRLQTQATDIGDPGKDELYGYGLLNAKCSVNPATTGC